MSTHFTQISKVLRPLSWDFMLKKPQKPVSLLTEKREYGFMKMTIDLPDGLFRRAKATAAVEGVTLKEFITKAVESKLENASQDWRQVIAQLPRVPKETLEVVRRRVEEADRESLKHQQREFSSPS